ncbi:CHAT domain-containing protein [Xanthobacter autotrophicus]|uniref:CHAT domain-containing protein n=1 Tax=Xanthobacter autotrophicus TaxID=280 RepID=UPI00372B6E80
MPSEPLRTLIEALADPIDEVRIGAARAALRLAPKGAAGLLATRAAALPAPLPVAETATLALALERAGADGLELAGRLLQASQEEMAAALSGDGNDWVQVSTDLAARTGRPGPFHILQPLYVARCGQSVEPEDAEPDLRKAWAAQWAFRAQRLQFEGFGADAEAAVRLDRAFIAILQCLDALDLDGAIPRLLDIAVTGAEETTRCVARKMLPAFGTLASGPLLTLLARRSSPKPEAMAKVMANIKANWRGNVPAGISGERLAAFLASEALEGFTDTATAFAVVRGALSWEGAARTRAERVAGHLSADVALPVLFWCALNLPAAAERNKARELLLRILAQDPALGIRLPRVGSTDLKPDALSWLRTLLLDEAAERMWTDDIAVTIPLLAEAIAALPDIAGSTGVFYQDLGTADRLDNYIRSEDAAKAPSPPVPSVPEVVRRDAPGRPMEPIPHRPSSPLDLPGVVILPMPAPAPSQDSGTLFGRIAQSIGKVVREGIFTTSSPPQRGRIELPDHHWQQLPQEPAQQPGNTSGFELKLPPPMDLAPAETQMRHPLATFPASSTVGQSETLTVSLRAHATPATTLPFPLAFLSAQTELKLLVLVMAPAFEVDPAFQVLTVPRAGDSDEVGFTLVPRRAGRQSIDIKFLLGTEVLGHCGVATDVAETAGAAVGAAPSPGDGAAVTGEAQTIVFEPFAREAAGLRGEAHAVLQVKTRPDGQLDWTLFKRGVAPVLLGLSPGRFGPENAAALGAQQGTFIRQTLENDLASADLTAVLEQLSALGYQLYSQVAPPALMPALADLPDNAILVIDSDADWVPWELLACAPGDALWGDRFSLVRAPVATVPPNAVVAVPADLPKALDRAALVVGDGIDRPARMDSRTFGDKADRARPILIERDWGEIADACKGKDIVHFVCHGLREPAYHLSMKSGIGGHLYPAQVHRLGLKWGAVVFANACSSASSDLMLAEFQSFGREFYFAGARPFIGTLGPVPTAEAIAFAALFYEEFAVAGLPAGQAMRRAKQRAADTFRKPIWLYYCLYGHASACRAWSTG